MRRRRAVLATTGVPQLPQLLPGLSLEARRARAMERAWPLLATSVPTRDILESYLNDVIAEP